MSKTCNEKNDFSKMFGNDTENYFIEKNVGDVISKQKALKLVNE